MESSNEKKSIKISLKQLIIGILVIILMVEILVLLFIFLVNNDSHELKKIDKDSAIAENTLKQANENIVVVPTLLDEIQANSSWCGTFQLIWNDMKNEVIKKDIVFNKQLKIVENLNKETFTTKDISDAYYYKAFGERSPELKEVFKKGIKEKFDQSSDILDKIDWSKSSSPLEKIYVFYTMLYKEFNFEHDFNTLENDSFYSGTDTYEDIEYFGIEKESSSELYNQVDVLYYNSRDDFAVILNTKEDDEIILTVGDNGATFADIYNSVVEKANNFEGETEFGENDFLKVPKLDFNILKKYSELTTDGTDDNKFFFDYQNNRCHIADAMQSIEMELDKSGGKVKSEAVMTTVISFSSIDVPTEVEERYFYCNREFTIFIKEEGKNVPYFAANIANIELFQ